MSRVWIAQCLCPKRHAILAAANEADDRSEAEALIPQLRERVVALLADGTFNPWCGPCRSPSDAWTYELARTSFRSMEEAVPALRRSEAEQAVTRDLLGQRQ